MLLGVCVRGRITDPFNVKYFGFHPEELAFKGYKVKKPS